MLSLFGGSDCHSFLKTFYGNRGWDWDKKEPDSIFIVRLEPRGRNTILHAIHSNVPDKAAEGINKGWHSHYWEPWKLFLAGKPIAKPPVI